MYLHLGAHTKTVEAFDELLIDIGLAVRDKDLNVVREREMQVAGPHRFSDQTGVDGEGFPIMTVKPGYFWNIRVWGDLRNSLLADPDEEKKLMDRMSFKTGMTTETKGDIGDTEMPEGLSSTNGRVFDLSLINTQRNVWA